MKEFLGDDRQALFLNSYDIFPQYDRFNGHCRGNQRCYELEYLLTGNIQSVQLPSDFARAIASHHGPGVKGLASHLTIGYSDELIPELRSKIPAYRSETIFPDEQQHQKLPQVLERFQKKARNTTCTFVYLTGHGLPGEFCLSQETSLQYTQLLETLGTIPGKKVLIVMACYSGSLIKILEERNDKHDFSAITSTSAEQTGVNWNEDRIHRAIISHLSRGRKISALVPVLKRLVFDRPTSQGEQKPQVSINFDIAV